MRVMNSGLGTTILATDKRLAEGNDIREASRNGQTK